MKLINVLRHLIFNSSINRFDALLKYDVHNLTDIIHRLRNYGIDVRYRKDSHGDFLARFWYIPYDNKEGAYKVLGILKK
jgi:hypothetical protein